MKIALAALALVLAPSLPTPASAQDSQQGGISALPPIQTGAARAAAAKDAQERKAAMTPLDEAVTAAKREGQGRNWTEDEGNAGFDARTRAQVRIMSLMGQQDGMRHFKILFDPKLGVKDNSFEFRAMFQDVRLLHVRGVKKFVALDYSVGTQYYDAENFARYIRHSWDPSVPYQQAGSFDGRVRQMNDVTDAGLVADILVHRLGVGADDPMIATVRERIQRNAHGKPFVVAGSEKMLYLGVGEEGMTIWPNEKKAQ